MTTSAKVIGKIDIVERINPKRIRYTKCSECGKTVYDNSFYDRYQIINGKELHRIICDDCHNSGGEFDDLAIDGRVYPRSIFD